MVLPKVSTALGGTAEFTNHSSTNKEGVARDGSPEGFDSNGGQLNSQITFRLTIDLQRVAWHMV